MMKRILSIATLLTFVLCLGGCSSAETENSSDNSITTTATESKSDESTAVSDNTDKSSKILVAYYSSTGTTENVAEIIAEHTNADVFKIMPKNEYTSDDLDWTNEKSRVFTEHDNENARDVELVKATVDNFDKYDTIFIGYPIWWGIAAWPVDNFVKSNDFSGKTVIPFCTASSSDIGESGEQLKQMSNGGEWKDGRRFYSSTDKQEINAWVDSLEL